MMIGGGRCGVWLSPWAQGSTLESAWGMRVAYKFAQHDQRAKVEIAPERVGHTELK
ncbi:hypothetical protein T484DRAFT_1921340 [Baffinella frigidus]|nr:hypothetical protein T484DRAFT_1921340 [Cryptophyta sp. CCMP2293]